LPHTVKFRHCSHKLMHRPFFHFIKTKQLAVAKKTKTESDRVSYYAKRNNLINTEFSIDLEDLRTYFYQTYKYFEDKGYFKSAFKGIYIEEDYKSNYLVLSKTMSPTPEIFFITHLENNNVLPIYDNHEYFTEEQLFSIIEIFYDHIAYYDYQKEILVKEAPKIEFATHINNLLKRYNTGYYLNENQGFIMNQPNQALKELMNSEPPETMGDIVLNQLNTATKMYYRFNSNEEEKKKAINILADILEPIRTKLENLLNEEYDISKDKHDRLIFDIFNNFHIRHNLKRDHKNYSKPIWYDHMMQYYSSVILTYYRLIADRKTT
jgi:hypothetical protein